MISSDFLSQTHGDSYITLNPFYAANPLAQLHDYSVWPMLIFQP